MTTSIMESMLEYRRYRPDFERYIRDLHGILECHSSKHRHCFYDTRIKNRIPSYKRKQIELYHLGRIVGPKVCEIGFNSGHNALLLLQSNQIKQYLMFDVCDNPSTHQIVTYLHTNFPSASLGIHQSDTIQVMYDYMEQYPHHVGTFNMVYINPEHV